MTIKERKILDKEIQYLCEYQDRVQAIREYTNINPHYSFLKEVETIESLYKEVLAYRKDDENKSNCFSDRKSTRLNSSHIPLSRMPSSA